MIWNFQTWNTAREDSRLRVQAAYDFLATGKTPPKCTSSSQCATGWACIDGECVFQSASGSENTCDTGPTGGNGGCSTNTSTGCTIPTCGASGTEEECCGDRCCRFTAAGGGSIFVQCFCGSCPRYNGERCNSDSQCASGYCIGGYCGQDGQCSAFCDGYYKSTGKLYPGCREENVCDECSFCNEDLPKNACEKSETGPCWCVGCEPNHQCNKDGSCSPIRVWACRDFTKCGVPTGDKCCSDNPRVLYSLEICQNRVINAPCDDEDTGNPCDQYCQDKQSSENPQIEVTAEGMIDPNGPNTFVEYWDVTIRTQFFYGGPCVNYGDPSWNDFRLPINGSYNAIGTGGVSYTPGPTVTYTCPTAAASGPDYITRAHTSVNGALVTGDIEGPRNFYSQFTPTPILSWSVRQVWTPGNPANAVPASELIGANAVAQGSENWVPDCAPGCECTKQGFISAEGETVYFYKECCYQNAPEELNCEKKECDCAKNPETCDQECDTCEVCDRQTNKCVADPTRCNEDMGEVPYGWKGFITDNYYHTLTIIDEDSCVFGSLPAPDGRASFQAIPLTLNTGVCTMATRNLAGIYTVGNTYTVSAGVSVTVSDTVSTAGWNGNCGDPSGYLVRKVLS